MDIWLTLKTSVFFFINGSKDPGKEIAGAGIVIFSENNGILHIKGMKLDHKVSIYSFELSAIGIPMKWLLVQLGKTQCFKIFLFKQFTMFLSVYKIRTFKIGV